jgi:four helix bundle protein
MNGSRGEFGVRGSEFGVHLLAMVRRATGIAESITFHYEVMDERIYGIRSLEAFQRCRAFACELAGLLKGGRFARDPELIHQMRKAMLSVYANFAEGFERDGNKEFAQFLSQAKGSVGELRGHMVYAFDNGLISKQELEVIDHLGLEASRMLGGLMRYLNDSDFQGRKFKFRRLQAYKEGKFQSPQANAPQKDRH